MPASARRPFRFRAVTAGLALALAGTLFAQAEQPEQPRNHGFFWKAESETATVYLLGSVHVGRPDFYPLRPAIEKAFAASSALAVEVDMRPSRQLAAMGEIMKAAMLPPGENLRDSLSDDLRALLDAYTEKAGPGMGMALDRMTPWWAALSIAMLEMQKAGLNPLWGIDLHFLTRAEKKDMQVIELEGAQQQIAIFASMEPALQRLMLKQTLQDIGKAREQIEVMMNAWETGDEKALVEFLGQGFEANKEFEPLRKKLFTERDIAMTRRIREFLAGDRAVFVVVGAGHMVGEEGIVARLKKDKNLTVTRQ